MEICFWVDWFLKWLVLFCSISSLSILRVFLVHVLGAPCLLFNISFHFYCHLPSQACNLHMVLDEVGHRAVGDLKLEMEKILRTNCQHWAWNQRNVRHCYAYSNVTEYVNFSFSSLSLLFLCAWSSPAARSGENASRPWTCLDTLSYSHLWIDGTYT